MCVDCCFARCWAIASAHGERLLANFLRLASEVRPRPVRAASPPPVAPPAPAPRPPPLLHVVLPGAADAEALHAARFAGSSPSVWLDGSAAREGTRFSVLGDAPGPLAHWLTYRAERREITVHRGAAVERALEPRDRRVAAPQHAGELADARAQLHAQ